MSTSASTPESLASAPSPDARRRRRRLAVFLSVIAALALLIPCAYLFAFRLSTRGPGLVASGRAADFSLRDDAGKAITLASLTAHGPAVLVFYRGHW